MKLFLQAAAAVFVTVYQHQLRGSRKNIDFLFLKAVVWRILTGFSGFPVFAQNLPPTARVENVTNEFFGMKVTDPYRWMKNLESKETQDWRRAQAVYADAHLRKLRRREDILKRLNETSGTSTFGRGIRQREKSVLLRVECDAVYCTGSTKEQINKEAVDVYAFLFQQLK